MNTLLKKRLPFRKNIHLARKCKLSDINILIDTYPKRYPTPKYLLFIKQMLESGWEVKLYKSGVSKYVFTIKGNDIFKIRFSNHKPIYGRQLENDCDFYVGISHAQVYTTEQIIAKINK